MRQELTWGTATAVAIVAAVGISSQSGNRPANPASASQNGQSVVRKTSTKGAPNTKAAQPQCADSIPLLEHFFLHQAITGPSSCYATAPTPTPLPAEFQSSFIIATFPDPLYTHFSLLFDRFVEAIQQGAQDEGYEYDSSWLPWETEELSLKSLKDQDDAEDRKEKRENQPGILIFRNSTSPQYKKALIVFIVGEESTRGIHRAQFENAVAWIRALQQPNETRTTVSILGPTFSGSFPSLQQLLDKRPQNDPRPESDPAGLNHKKGFAIYSGSASSRDDAEDFAKRRHIRFHSFVQDDTSEMQRICKYFGQKDGLHNVGIISEDETAYGHIVTREEDGATRGICEGATKIYYPRDISTLRSAYQSQSMFSSNSTQGQDNVQRKSLPTDLADPAGQPHDTVRTYAGNQVPLSQEALLLGIVDVLRAHRIQYVLLRSSNTLDPLFLANFLSRDYPDARVVVLNSDLLFQRGQDAMALSGVMTLSTYPLFSWAREWTALPPYDAHSHRVFPENSTEGTYIAARLLLQTMARDNNPNNEKKALPALNCDFTVVDSEHSKDQIFNPALSCTVTTDINSEARSYAPLPDYAPPYWMQNSACAPGSSAADCRPATWLSVITRNGTWPLAVLNDQTLGTPTAGTCPTPQRSGEHTAWPGIPRSTRILLVALCGLAIFHFLCCRFASFTAKPAFRAHFADAGRLHTALVVIGSYVVALMALFTGWGCGIFATISGPPSNTRPVWGVVVFVCCLCASAIAVNLIVSTKLNGSVVSPAEFKKCMAASLASFATLIAAFFFFWVIPIERVLILGNRAFVYWRSMNITSGVSPMVPYLALTVGVYFWFWYAMHGLALFGPDRPRLPSIKQLTLDLGKLPATTEETGDPVAQEEKRNELKLSMFSQENVAVPAESTARPLSDVNVIVTACLWLVLCALMFGLGHGTPVRNLGTTRASAYTRIYCLCLTFYCSFILSETLQIWRTWSCARQLLVFLDRLALRRTLSSLKGFSWGSVWKMSGNVLDVRYKLLSRQLECLTHLHRSITLFKDPTDPEEKLAFARRGDCDQAVERCRAVGVNFAKWYSKNYAVSNASDLHDFELFQESAACATGVVLTQLLMPASRVERHSLIQVDPDDKRGDDAQGPPPSKNELVRNSEELVCLTYLGFAQNLLGRIRTIVLGSLSLFLALSISVASYPFDPRTLLSGILLGLFVTFGATVFFVYADMHRDTTLSHITNTKPGELGTEFWIKILGFGAAPILALITQTFPEWSGFLFSWLQPGLSSLK